MSHSIPTTVCHTFCVREKLPDVRRQRADTLIAALVLTVLPIQLTGGDSQVRRCDVRESCVVHIINRCS